jgi:hypothetical protein
MAKRTLFSVLTAVLVAIGAFVYFTPDAPPPGLKAALRSAQVDADNASVSRAKPPKSPVTSPRAEAEQRNARGNARPKGKSRLDGDQRKSKNQGSRTVVRERTIIRNVSTSPSGGGNGVAAGPSAPETPAAPDPTSPPIPHTPTCDDFHWQQDAQAAYVMNLADPFGLDGPPGPADDDGVACSLLPVDPARPASTPAGAKPPPPPPPPEEQPPPTTPTLDALLNPQLNYFGVSTPQAPFDWKEYELFVHAAGEARPNMLLFFQGWDRDFPKAKITDIWRRQMLPLITWEPRQTVQQHAPSEEQPGVDGLTLKSIIDGEHDAYLQKYAEDVAALGLPVAIRLGHEMNGPWYPWSEQSNGNHKGEFVQMWRHVHDIFTAAGATNAIWVWSPSRVDPYPDIDLKQLYPGDEYVDWLGMTGYFRYVDQTPSFDRTFGKTLVALDGVAQKPILLSEVGATESGGNREKKVSWIKQFFEGIKANPQIIGFAWFDQSVEGNDWRIESSSAASSAFADGVADPLFGKGVWQAR